MAIVEFARKARSYQFPSAPLTALSLPCIDEAMQEARRTLFERNYGYLVEPKHHARFCLDSYRAGFLSDSDIASFGQSQRPFYLHQMTQKAVGSIGQRFSIEGDGLFEDRLRLETVLTKREVDKTLTAEVALGLVAAGLLKADDLHHWVSQGAYTAPLVAEACSAALKSLCADMNQSAYFTGNELTVETYEPVYFDFSLDDVPLDELHEFSVLMQKTFDAISEFIFPLHTPASTIGKNAYFCVPVDDAVSGMESVTSDLSVEGIKKFLQATPTHRWPFDHEVLGVCEEDDGEIDEESLDRLALLIAQGVTARNDYSYTLQGDSEEEKIAEVKALLGQAQELSTSTKVTAAAYAVLVELLSLALEYGEQPTSHLPESGDTECEGFGFFETIMIRMDESRLSGPYGEAYSYIDAEVNGCGVQPLVFQCDRDVVARSLVPTIVAMKRVFSLLQSLSSTVEALSQ